jgi:hypothetical protein
VIEKEKEQIFHRRERPGRAREAVVPCATASPEGRHQSGPGEILRRVQTLAAMYQIAPDKFLKDLQKRNGLVEIYDQLAHEKVMEFLENNAKVETVPAVEANPS